MLSSWALVMLVAAMLLKPIYKNWNNKLDDPWREHGSSVSIVDLSRGEDTRGFDGSAYWCKSRVSFLTLVERRKCLILPKVDILVFDASQQALLKDFVQNYTWNATALRGAQAF
jgi:hypothetical protein